jgi:hypothetical protein
MLNQIISNVIREATSDGGGGRGAYVPPMQPGLRPFSKESLAPFNQSVSKYKSPLVQYDSYDHTLDLKHDKIIELEKSASKAQDFIKNNPMPSFSEKKGYIQNRFFEKSNKAPFKEKMQPYTQKVQYNEWVDLTYKNVISEINDLVITKGDINSPEKINEDLAVWFGTKKKPKGSKQPKGPWVNICRKVDGKHPPCGRPDTNKGAYPKCRAAGVAGKMSDSAKKAACQQKRAAEKKDPQRGKGQKPVMTSYKPRKESLDQIIGNILSEVRNTF